MHDPFCTGWTQPIDQYCPCPAWNGEGVAASALNRRRSWRMRRVTRGGRRRSRYIARQPRADAPRACVRAMAASVETGTTLARRPHMTRTTLVVAGSLAMLSAACSGQVDRDRDDAAADEGSTGSWGDPTGG